MKTWRSRLVGLVIRWCGWYVIEVELNDKAIGVIAGPDREGCCLVIEGLLVTALDLAVADADGSDDAPVARVH